jgi:hypothetical protein
MKTVIEMAREADIEWDLIDEDEGQVWYITKAGLERLVELARADEREKYKWDVHSCGPTCTKVACVAMREAIQAEREACAKVCDEAAKKALALQSGSEDDLANVFLRHHAVAHQSDAADIRARSCV